MAPRSIYIIRSKHNVVKIGIAARPRKGIDPLDAKGRI